ncbi:hypothetical protein KS4_32920 [Poriferisphaera corsica]|uniref:Uncharacterized protein n=1 Tax=Poriferisphaera corsica TaxID=2528020 RepID=A0A517YYA6_9BACT|nr:hypothetical protein KS4_32920 [Poriferisphaera corsica]
MKRVWVMRGSVRKGVEMVVVDEGCVGEVWREGGGGLVWLSRKKMTARMRMMMVKRRNDQV